jgi:MFS family permease
MLKLPPVVWLLTCIQSLAMSAGAMMVLVGGVLGASLAPSSELATLPVAMMIVGTACGVLPVTRLMGRFGRKPIFVSVAIVAMLASLMAAFAASQQHFIGFLSASFVIGLAVSGFQQIRFAAMESVPPELMAKAASTVLLGGLVAAIIGPELVTFGRDLFAQAFAGTFVLMAGLCFICALLFTQIKETHVSNPMQGKQTVDIKMVLCNPVFIVAFSSSVVGYALMSFIMTATPVHMHVLEHHSLEHTKWVIQSHIIAMFLPSFISGWLISKLGTSKVIVLGLVAYLVTIALALADEQLINYWMALVLLGIGWNFLFLGGTVLLPTTYQDHQKIKVQGINELAVFVAQAIAALGAGAMLYILGWQGLMHISLLIICLYLALLIWQAMRLRAKTTIIEEQ